MKASDGIVLAADSRGTIGDPRGLTAINDSHTKIHQIGSCGVAFAGASEMGAVLLDELQKNSVDARCGNIDAAIAEIVPACAQYFSQWFGGIPPNQRPGVLITLAGYRQADPPEPMVYLLNSQANFAPQLFNNVPCMSGVPQYAVYLVHRYYDQSVSLENAKALAHYLIEETASQDPKVGGPIRIAEITAGSGFRELAEEEVAEIGTGNQELNQKLKEFFTKTGVP